ncbi:MAG: hypothetical protein Q9166_000900 [cf. Caloplaca sp. 2 TL-2023]
MASPPCIEEAEFMEDFKHVNALLPKTHQIAPITADYYGDLKLRGHAWLDNNVRDGARVCYMSDFERLKLLQRLFKISMPELMIVVEGLGVWIVPHAVGWGDATVGIAVMMYYPGHRWLSCGVGMHAIAGAIALKGYLTRDELDDISLGRFPRSLADYGRPGSGLFGQPREGHMAITPARPPPGPEMHALYATERNHVARSPPPEAHGRRYIDHGYGMDRSMEQSIVPMRRHLPRQPAPVPHQRRGPVCYTGGIIVSSSDSDGSTDANSDSGSDSAGSDLTKKPKKSKTTKGKGKGKLEAKPRKKRKGRKQSLSGSEDEPKAPRRPKKSGDNRGRGRDNPPRRRRPASDDETAYSADEGRDKGRLKAPARGAARGCGRSDDEEDPSLRAGRRPAPWQDRRDPMSGGECQGGKALKPPGQRAGGRNRGRSPSDDEGQGPSNGKPLGRSTGSGDRNRGRSLSDDEPPPALDPAEEARLDALKAQNGYMEGKTEKKGWH